MSLTPGSRIGVYEVRGAIGAGGMGEVFRATDARLNREVAIKVLPDEFATDRERLARFQREAQVLASINHPNIAVVYGLEEVGPVHALVMELVEGDDLSVRLGRGTLPLDEALRIALQVAEALEAAHERGIVHRDLKPANVKVAPDGRVKVLDFGLAKSVDAAPGADPLHSPTLSLGATQAGVILGTAAYMSPEQASGMPADKRADVWSFGVLLFELLSGRRLFDGETVSHTLADVLRAEIDWSLLPRRTPASVRQLLARCLERNRRRRLRDIGEARIVLEDELSRPGGLAVQASEDAPAPPRVWKRPLQWAAAGVLLGAGLGAALALAARVPAELTRPLTIEVAVADEPFYAGPGSSLAMTLDGARLAYVLDQGGDRRALNVRDLNQLTSRTLVQGTGPGSSPYQPFFSPDGQWLGFVTSSELRKIPVSGGSPVTLTAVNRSRGATWLADDTIVFAAGLNSGLFRIPAAGGDPVPLTELNAGEVTHRWPQALPGSRGVLFTASRALAADSDTSTIEVVTLDTKERKTIHAGGTFARYVATGHLTFVNKGTVFALPFDLDRMEATGSAIPVLHGVRPSIAEGAAHVAFSDTGLLTYLTDRDAVAPTYPIVWVNRGGGSSPLLDEPGSYANPRLSPDGRFLSLTVLRDRNWDIWIRDLEREVSTRFTFSDADDTEQIWSADGRWIAFSSNRHGRASLFRRPSNGSRQEEQIAAFEGDMWPTSWSPDGNSVLVMIVNRQFDILRATIDGGKLEPLLDGAFSETDGAYSPDGQWVAYTSTESGRSEVYVRAVASDSGRWQVSDGGGAFPRWAGSGRELFYRTDEGIMAVAIEPSGTGLRTGRPEAVVRGDFRGGVNGLSIVNNTFADYDVSADGRRFVLFPAERRELSRRRETVTLVTGWFDELRRLAAAQRPD